MIVIAAAHIADLSGSQDHPIYFQFRCENEPEKYCYQRVFILQTGGTQHHRPKPGTKQAS